jgi:fumarylacetoacetase
MNQETPKSWIDIDPKSDFSLHNIPFGIISTENFKKHAATIIGNFVVDLNVLHNAGYFKGIGLPSDIFRRGTLNDFISLGKATAKKVRKRLIELFEADNYSLQYDSDTIKIALITVDKVIHEMPIYVPNYTDFYSSLEHATNVGVMFRGAENALLPNWKHIPVGYHGRASSIVPSGVNIHRPKGQKKKPEMENPVFGPSEKMDFELEMGFVVGKDTDLGSSISVDQAKDYIFGFVLFNDWSARDIQQWEYVPLGPFLGKNFASSISPWIVTLEALEFARTEGPIQSPEPLSYLKQEGPQNFDIELSVYLESNGVATEIVKSNYKYMYWSAAQQLAHHTINGCNIQVGDIYASGTISGPEKENYGSMLERSWNGKEPIELADGQKRTFIEDGDTIIMKGFAKRGNVRVGFGEVRTQLLPAKP